MPNPIVNASENHPWQSFEDHWRFHQYDNFVNGGALYQSLAPGEAQYSEWSQQMTATMYQNWYNSAPEQMKRALEAGINPFIAASGIAGNGAGSVSPAPSAVNNSAAPAMLSAAGSALGSLGSTFGNVAQGISLLQKLRPEINKINAETQGIFESLGFTKLQSKALSIQLQYLDQKEQIGIWQALATFDRTKQEYQNLVATHQNILAQYDEIIEHKELLIQQQGEVEARKLVNDAMKGKIEEETRFTKADNDFFEQHHYRLGTPIYDSIRDMMVSDGFFDMETYGNTIAGYEGKISTAVESAKAAASWDYRPSTLEEVAAYAGHAIGSSLRELILSSQGVSDWSSLAKKLQSNVSASREFNQAFNDAKEDLYEEYLSKKRYYRNIRRGGNTQEIARAKNAMENAKANFEKLTKQHFADELIKSISSRSR